jgi:hypothetical protein
MAGSSALGRVDDAAMTEGAGTRVGSAGDANAVGAAPVLDGAGDAVRVRSTTGWVGSRSGSDGLVHELDARIPIACAVIARIAPMPVRRVLFV